MNTAAERYLNRQFQFNRDDWIEVLRAGEWPHPNGQTQVIDGAALDAVVAAFERDSAQPNSPGLLVDFDHFSFDTSKPSEAAGWITELRREGDSVLARVDWTESGEEAARGGRYRMLSPVFRQDEIEDLGDNRFRPLRLDGVGLTNQPVMRGLTPICNRNSVANRQDLSTLTPRRAGELFSAEVQRVKQATGWPFARAWDAVQESEPLLWNRMSQAPASSPVVKEIPRVRSVVGNRRAANAWLTLASAHVADHGGTFAAGWDIVRNRFPTVQRLANSALDESEWDALAAKAFQTWNATLGPNNERINSSKPESVRKEFVQCWDAALRAAPTKDPAAIWEQIKTSYPSVFWPFVILLADSAAA